MSIGLTSFKAEFGTKDMTFTVKTRNRTENLQGPQRKKNIRAIMSVGLCVSNFLVLKYSVELLIEY